MAKVDEQFKSDDFVKFWRHHIEDVMALFGDRAKTYSSLDLQMIGFSLMNSHQQKFQLLEQELLGVLFYLQGKIARAMSAMFRGQTPTADTLDDMIVYGLMAKFRFYLIGLRQENESTGVLPTWDLGVSLPEKLSPDDVAMLRQAMQKAVEKMRLNAKAYESPIEEIQSMEENPPLHWSQKQHFDAVD